MKGRRRSKQWPSALLNNVTFDYWYQTLKGLAINRFEWTNLPDTVDPRFLEQTLFEKGYALFFQDDVMLEYLALTTTISGRWNVYNIPLQRRAYASNSYNCDRDITNSVVIWNNFNHLPDISTARLYALKLYNIERSIDVNVQQQKFPAIIQSSEEQRLVMKNLMEQYEGNVPFIFGDSTLTLDGIKVLNLGAPFVSDRLEELKQKIIGEYLTYMGIENNSNEKRERMISDEIGSNYGSIEAYRNMGLNARQQACDEINTMFGLNIGVRYRSSLPTLVNGGGDAPKIDNRRELNLEEKEVEPYE